MKRFCCFTLFKAKTSNEQIHIKPGNIDESARIVDNGNKDRDPKVLPITNYMGANFNRSNVLNSPSFGSSQQVSISCPHLVIEKNANSEVSSEYRNPFQNSLRCENRNNHSFRLYGSSSQRRPPSHSSITKTSSFKRMMSFRSSTKRDLEIWTFQMNFLGQIYRKKEHSFDK
nr:uncharacterized protein LOC121123237 [Lepeophtheirus salmonis]